MYCIRKCNAVNRAVRVGSVFVELSVRLLAGIEPEISILSRQFRKKLSYTSTFHPLTPNIKINPLALELDI